MSHVRTHFDSVHSIGAFSKAQWNLNGRWWRQCNPESTQPLPTSHLLSPLYFYLLLCTLTLPYLVSTVRATLLCSSRRLSASQPVLFPFRVAGETDIGPLRICPLYYRGILTLLSLMWRSTFMVSGRDSGSAERMCANTGAWTQVFQSKGSLLTHYITVLAFFLSEVSPILNLQHWVIVISRNPMACLWPVSRVKSMFGRFEMEWERERSVSRCRGL